MNAYIIDTIQYYLAFNSDRLLLRYYLVAAATAVCYSSILVSVTRRLVLMKVKVCLLYTSDAADE